MTVHFELYLQFSEAYFISGTFSNFKRTSVTLDDSNMILLHYDSK